jgi:hypothetical protein
MAESLNCCCRPRLPFGGGVQTISGSNQPLTHASICCRSRDRQRSALLQAVIVRRPILGLVLHRGPTAHRTQLSRWIHTVNPIRPFVNVWMPPSVQEISEQIERVIGCGHVSGLLLQRLIQPRAGMAMRGPEADQQNELMGSCTKTALSGPDLSDHFPLLFIDLLTNSSPRTRCQAHCAHAIVAAGIR